MAHVDRTDERSCWDCIYYKSWHCVWGKQWFDDGPVPPPDGRVRTPDGLVSRLIKMNGIINELNRASPPWFKRMPVFQSTDEVGEVVPQNNVYNNCRAYIQEEPDQSQ